MSKQTNTSKTLIQNALDDARDAESNDAYLGAARRAGHALGLVPMVHDLDDADRLLRLAAAHLDQN